MLSFEQPEEGTESLYCGARSGRTDLIFGLTQPLTFLTIAFDFPLVLLDLLLILLVLRLFLTLHVISNERAGTQTQSPADSSASSGMPYGRANDAAGGRAADSANARSFFSRGHGSAGTSGKHDNGKNQREYLQREFFCISVHLCFAFLWVLWISRIGCCKPQQGRCQAA